MGFCVAYALTGTVALTGTIALIEAAIIAAAFFFPWTGTEKSQPRTPIAQ